MLYAEYQNCSIKYTHSLISFMLYSSLNFSNFTLGRGFVKLSFNCSSDFPYFTMINLSSHFSWIKVIAHVYVFCTLMKYMDFDQLNSTLIINEENNTLYKFYFHALLIDISFLAVEVPIYSIWVVNVERDDSSG